MSLLGGVPGGMLQSGLLVRRDVDPSIVYDPESLGDLEMWLDATELTGYSNGENVTSLADATGNGHTAAEATNPPTFYSGSNTREGLAGLLFDTVSERLDVPASAALSGSDLTYVVIAKLNKIRANVPSMSCWFFNKAQTNPATISLRIGQTGFEALSRRDGDEGTVLLQTTDAFVDQSIRMHVVRGDASVVKYGAGSAFRGFEDIAENARPTGFDADNDGVLSIGNHPTSGNTDIVDRVIYEVMVFKRYLSDADVAYLQSYFEDKYSGAWLRISDVFPASERKSCKITQVGTTAYMVYGNATNTALLYSTAPDHDPHNWTDQGTLISPAFNTRSGRLIFNGSTWYLFADDRTNGVVRLYTGASLASLTEHASSPVLSGSGTDWEQYVRHPFVLGPDETDDGLWHMLYDGRNASTTSGDGAVGHATSPDGVTWTRDAANNPVIDASGIANFDAFDCGEPSAYWDGSQYHVFWAGYRSQDVNGGYPHHVGYGTSADLSTVTKDTLDHILSLSAKDAAEENNAHISPCPYAVSGENLNLYYCGFDVGVTHQIYHARAAIDIATTV